MDFIYFKKRFKRLQRLKRFKRNINLTELKTITP